MGYDGDSFLVSEITDDLQLLLKDTLEEAPYVPGAFRLTLVVGQYYQNAVAAFKTVSHQVQGPWANASKALYTQIMIWYMVCGVWDLFFCNNAMLQGVGWERTRQSYSDDYDMFVDSVEDLCEVSLGCFISSHIFTAAGGYTSQLNGILRRRTASIPPEKKISYLNLFDLTSLKPDELHDGHFTPMIATWVLHMFLNAICEYPGREMGCPQRIRFSKGCSGENLPQDASCAECQCPLYWQLCMQEDDGCKNWECMGNRECTYEIDTPGMNSAGAGFYNASEISQQRCDVFNTLHTSIAVAIGGDEIAGGSNDRQWQGWILALGSVALLIVVLELLRWNKRRAYAPANDVETEVSKDDKDGAKPKRRNYLEAISFARYIASLHIVVGHLAAKGGIVGGVYLYGFGFTWVPWFFMLSGYILTHARLCSSRPDRFDDPLTFMWKRLASVFPMYALGVLLSAINKMAWGRPLPSVWNLLLQSWLLQSFIPTVIENTLQVHCWFLSCMIVYYVCFGFAYTHVRVLAPASVLGMLLGIAAIPWIAACAIPSMIGEPLEWYSSHKFGATETSVDVWTTFVKFNPICYFHVFLFGMLIAKLRCDMKEGSDTKYGKELGKALGFLSKFGATIGYSLLVCIFTLEYIRPPAYKISTRLSILMPLHGLMFLGLSSKHDPVSIVFGKVPQIFGSASYAQYVLQFLAWDVWPCADVGYHPSFFIFLTAISMVSQLLVQDSCRKYIWMRHKLSLLIGPVILTACLVTASLMYDPKADEAAFAPAWVDLSAQGYKAIDMQLNFSAQSTEGAVINPSLALQGTDLIIAARVHKVSTTVGGMRDWGNNTDVVEMVNEWKSSIVVGKAAFDRDAFFGWNSSAWSLDFDLEKAAILTDVTNATSLWGSTPLCEARPSYIEKNNTLIRKVVTGPEDPKWVHSNGDSLLTFNSVSFRARVRACVSQSRPSFRRPH